MTWIELTFWSFYALGTIAMWGFFIVAVWLGTRGRRTWVEGPGPARKPGDSDRTPWYEAERKARGRQARGLR